MTTVDVVIPCYRYGKFLKECVESVTSQVGVDVRVLIIDDASPDGSGEIGAALAREDCRVEFRQHRTNQGHIATYNEGIDWASSDLFLLLSADDYLAPGALVRAASLIGATPEMSFAFGNATLKYDDGSQIARKPFGDSLNARTAVFSCNDFVKAMQGRNIVPTPTAVVRTTAQKSVGGYSHELPHAGDMAMWLSLSAVGPVGFVGANQAIYRMHSHNMSHSYSAARLPDIQQRYAAIMHFLATGGSRQKNADRLRRLLLRDLAGNAAAQASAAFDEDEAEVSRQLADLAREIYPRICYTAPWLRLYLHKLVGQQGWRLLRGALGVSR
ncbi:glycosyltransferase [Rhizobium cauense]|uniref:glycosyltransferase family 2 protein n=1 Tax=Rhizobium cauense TaxID=1166683 RepID=UPI001C6EA846|nr:glycosyltransferase [Rhizobium cauense]MBW9113740.1 glycosyltransferase [Rhizobium cauense]